MSLSPHQKPTTQGNPLREAGAVRITSSLFGRQILFRLVLIRRDLGFTQEALAKRAGVSVRTIWRAETGGFISFEYADKIARSLGLPLKMFWESHEGEKKYHSGSNCKGPQEMQVVPNLRERRREWGSQHEFAGMAEIGLRTLSRAEGGQPVKQEIAERIERVLKK